MDEVPNVDINVELPSLEVAGRIVFPASSPWRNAEREAVLGLVTTAAIRADRWCPISTEIFGELLAESPWAFFGQRIVNATWELHQEEFLQVITVHGHGYLVPLPPLAETLAHCQLRTAPAMRS